MINLLSNTKTVILNAPIVILIRQLTEKDLARRGAPHPREILRSLHSLRMTKTDLQRGFIKLTKRTLILLLAVLILLPSFSYLFLFKFPKTAKAEWYDETWSYRTSYSNNNTGSAVTNQQIKLDIDTATLITNSKIQADCDDSRFTDEGDYI